MDVVECQALPESVEIVRSLTQKDLIVDCLLGTGAHGAVRSPLDEVILAVNQSTAQVIAVDVPSGMNCDDGTVVNVCVKAHVTVTFVATKSGFDNPDAAAFVGRLSVAHIGLPASWVEAWLTRRRRKHCLPRDGID